MGWVTMSRRLNPVGTLSHLDGRSQACMVDVGNKRVTDRQAVAHGVILLPPPCQALMLHGGDTAKGNVLGIARIAGIMAAKRTDALIPLCHQLPLSRCDLDFSLTGARLRILATVSCRARTGVEMEALVAVSIAALTVYDMLKALSHDLVIERIELISKRGGRSGSIQRTVAA